MFLLKQFTVIIPTGRHHNESLLYSSHQTSYHKIISSYQHFRTDCTTVKVLGKFIGTETFVNILLVCYITILNMRATYNNLYRISWLIPRTWVSCASSHFKITLVTADAMITTITYAQNSWLVTAHSLTCASVIVIYTLVKIGYFQDAEPGYLIYLQCQMVAQYIYTQWSYDRVIIIIFDWKSHSFSVLILVSIKLD